MAEKPKSTHKLYSKGQRLCRLLLPVALFFWNIIYCARCIFTYTWQGVQWFSWYFLPIQIHLQFHLPIKCKKTAKTKKHRGGKRHLAKKHTTCLKFPQRNGEFFYFTSSPVLQTTPFLRYFPGGLLLKHPVWFQEDMVIIAASRRGLAKTWRLFYNISCHCQEGKGVKGSLWSWVDWWREHSGIVRGEHSSANSSLHPPSVITIVDITANFLISVLFPVNCSYLNLWTLTFVSPTPLSIPPEGEGWYERKANYLGCFNGNTKLGNTIPKPWHMLQ